MKEMIRAFINDEGGATMVEYAILVALIAVAVITTVGLLGTEINNKFDEVVNALTEEETAP